MIGSIEHEVCTKMLRHASEKLGAKFPATTPSYSMIKIACRLDDTFSEIFKLEACPVEDQSLQQQKDKKRRKRKGEKKNQN